MSKWRDKAEMKQHYEEYHGTPEQIKKRSERNKARREMEKKGLVKKGDGMDVDHKKPMRAGGTNAKGNLRVIPASRNRGWKDGKV
jgi:hypothetical protein